MKNSVVKKISLICVLIFLVLVCLPACEIISNVIPREKSEISSFEPYKKDYSLKEAQLLNEADFRSINTVRYDGLQQQFPLISEEFRTAVNDFAKTVYASIRSTAVKDDFAFSPLSLYELLCVAALGSNDQTALTALDRLLGMTKETRKADFINAYTANYLSGENGTLQMYNAAFLTNDYTPNVDYVSALTDHFVEAFSMNFRSDSSVKKLLDWVDAKMGEKNFLTKEDLELKKDTIAYLFSTVFFDNKWSNAFVLTSNYEDTFYGKTEKTVSYMRHYYKGAVYDYGEYVSCYDYYRNGMKIQYFVPKDEKSDIYELTKNKNLFDPSSDVLSDDEYIINLSLPQFSSECALNLKEVLASVGLAALFDRSGTSFNYMFSDLPKNATTYLTTAKQKNKVSFSVDGTIIKSTVYIQKGGATSAAPRQDGPSTKIYTYDVKLDQPFIYVVYDKNDLPLYVGHVDMP